MLIEDSGLPCNLRLAVPTHIVGGGIEECLRSIRARPPFACFRQYHERVRENGAFTSHKKGRSELPNIASVLKDEIVRVARKALRAETDGLKKASSHYRSEIAALKRRIAGLEHELARLGKQSAKVKAAPTTSAAEGRVRFSAKGLQAMRKRLDLSAGKFGRLLSVSPQTIYNWEAGTTRPRRNQIAAIAALRGIGKREAQARANATA